MSPRIPYAAPEPGSKTEAMLQRLPLNVLRMLAHHPEGLRGFQTLGEAILNRSALDPALRELAILRVGWLVGAAYETAHHERIGRAVGMSEAQIAAARSGDRAGLSEDDALVLDVAEEIEAGGLSEATFARAAQRFSHRELVELALACGYYGMVSRFLKSFAIPLEDDAISPPARG